MLRSASTAGWSTFGVIVFLGHCVSSFLFVPEELPSILRMIYSKTPPIKKGVDSKFGIGLRIGDHADFQVLLELGPQQVAEPISNDIDDYDFKKETKMKKVRQAKFAREKYKTMQKNKGKYQKLKLNLSRPKEKDYLYKKNDEKNQGSHWLAKWKREFVRRFSDTIAPGVLPIKTISRRVNRMKVVESTSNHSCNRDSNDLIILKRLFENVPR